MDEGANGGGTNVLLAAVFAGLVIVVAILGFLMLNDRQGGHLHDRAFDRASVTPFH